MPVTVRLLAASEWRLWRDVALRALADSPDAFRPTLAETNDRPEAFWREAVAPTVAHERGNLWIAVDGDDPVGKLFARIDEELTTVYIGAMWVAPDLRGAGVGRRLMQAAEEWGKDSGVTRSELWVTATNQAAVSFYESLDYLPTDDTQMLREGSKLVVRKLQKTI
jgi:GNAT superfamily N-acetyltransferase